MAFNRIEGWVDALYQADIISLETFDALDTAGYLVRHKAIKKSRPAGECV